MLEFFKLLLLRCLGSQNVCVSIKNFRSVFTGGLYEILDFPYVSIINCV